MPKTTITANQITSNNEFLDVVTDRAALKNDAALSSFLQVAPPVISKIRHGRLPVGPILMIRVHELTGMLFSDIRRYIPKTA